MPRPPRPSSAQTRNVHAFAVTHRGKVRLKNEDAFVVGDKARASLRDPMVEEFRLTADGALVAVIDGMGGLGGGDIAAGFLANCWAGRRIRTPAALKRSLVADHAALLAESRGSATPLMGAVATGASLHPAHINLFHVGDSRAYQVGRTKSVLLTRDHVNERGVLTQGFGGGDLPGLPNELMPQMLRLPWPATSDALLFVSDGAWRYLSPALLSSVYAACPEPREFVITMAGIILESPADDNLTLLVVKSSGGA